MENASGLSNPSGRLSQGLGVRETGGEVRTENYPQGKRTQLPTHEQGWSVAPKQMPFVPMLYPRQAFGSMEVHRG